jgi:hypothetical protein
MPKSETGSYHHPVQKDGEKKKNNIHKKHIKLAREIVSQTTHVWKG